MLYVWERENSAPIGTRTERAPKVVAPIVRRASPPDAMALAQLLTALGYPATAAQVERRIADAAEDGRTAVFVADYAGRVVGLLSFHCIPLFHEEGFLGRITSLVVAPEYRRRGIGRMLIAAGERFGWARRCTRIEVTSSDHRQEAHAFYERLGYQSDCRRFIKTGAGA